MNNTFTHHFFLTITGHLNLAYFSFYAHFHHNFHANGTIARAKFINTRLTRLLLALLSKELRPYRHLFALIRHLDRFHLLNTLLVWRHLLLTLFLFRFDALRNSFFAHLLRLNGNFLSHLIRVTRVDLWALSALTFFATRGRLGANVLTLARYNVRLYNRTTLLNNFLLLRFNGQHIRLVGLFVRLVRHILHFTRLANNFESHFFLLFRLYRRTYTLLLLLTCHTLFHNSVNLGEFRLIALVHINKGNTRRCTDTGGTNMSSKPSYGPTQFRNPYRNVGHLSPRKRKLFRSRRQLADRLLQSFRARRQRRNQHSIEGFTTFGHFRILVAGMGRQG